MAYNEAGFQLKMMLSSEFPRTKFSLLIDHPQNAKISYRRLYSSYPSFITNKTEHIIFKSVCVVRVAKHLTGDWFIVLR